MTKILIVEDDAEISRLTAMYLEAEGFDTCIIDDGAEALAAIKRVMPDLVILDIMLPGLSGIDICKQSRALYSGPLIVLTACDDDINEVSLLKLGADDFLAKPLKPHVLVARIEALLRRATAPAENQTQNEKSRFNIDLENQVVQFDDQTIHLTPAEYNMLILLQENTGQPVSREACCQTLRGIEYDFSNRSIDMRISSLRKKLNDDQMPYKVITTVRNKGYMLLNV